VWSAAAALLLTVSGPGALAGAQPVASTWTLVELPGGVAGLRRLLGPSLDASRVFVEAARRIDSPHEDEAGGRRDLRAYMDAVDTLSRALSGFPAGRASLSASRRPGPDAVALDGLVDALGLTWRDKGGGPGVDLAASPKAADRRRVLSHAGLDVESIARSANAGGAVQISLAIDRVPLPMPEAAWLSVAFDGNVRGGIARSVITDRRALLLAHGLASFDPAMLAWLTARPGLLRQVYRDHAGSFAVFGRSLRVEQGRVVPAGGERARMLWERMVGAQTSDPEGFALALLDRDEGRLAWLYDTVAHLDEPRAAHVLGLAAGEATGLARMEALARVFLVRRSRYLEGGTGTRSTRC